MLVEGDKKYHEDFVYMSQEELKQMTHVDLFRYRCKEAIVNKMKPYRNINNYGCKSDACNILMSLADQMANNLKLMEMAVAYGYGGEFSEIIYEETDKALQSYCGISIDDVWESNNLEDDSLDI